MREQINIERIKHGLTLVFRGYLEFDLEEIDESIDSHRDSRIEMKNCDFSDIRVFAHYDEDLMEIEGYELTEMDEYFIANSIDIQNLNLQCY